MKKILFLLVFMLTLSSAFAVEVPSDLPGKEGAISWLDKPRVVMGFHFTARSVIMTIVIIVLIIALILCLLNPLFWILVICLAILAVLTYVFK